MPYTQNFEGTDFDTYDLYQSNTASTQGTQNNTFLSSGTDYIARGTPASLPLRETVTGFSGNVLAFEDYDGAGYPVASVGFEFGSVDITGYTNLQISLKLAAGDGNSTSRYDDGDSLLIQYQVDGGAYVTVGRFVGSDDGPLTTSLGGSFFHDATLDGNTGNYTKVGTAASTYTFNINTITGSSITGSTMVIRVYVEGNGGSSFISSHEEILIDDISLTGTFSGTPPTITCPANITANSATGTCIAIATYTTPTCQSGCSGATVTQTAGSASGSGFPVGTTTNTFTVTNSFGSDNCSFTVTVNDTEAPTANCPLSSTVSTTAGSCDIVINYSTNHTDNCAGGTMVLTSGTGSGNAFGIGTNVELYTATDAAGNTATCSFSITVEDNEAPTATCPADMTVSADASSCSAMVTYAAATYADNCAGGGIALTSGSGSGVTFGVGINTEMYTSTDASGNTATCSFTITVQDGEAPSATCPADITVSADANGCDAVVTYAAATYLDNCAGGGIAMTSGLGSGSTFGIGTNTEMYTATDAAGNTATCSFTITVQDGEAPTATCPSDIIASTDAGNCDAMVTYSAATYADNCAGGGIALSAGNGSGGTFSQGTSTETYISTDAAGNTATCSFTITVQDGEAPSATCPADMTVSTDAGNCDAMVTYSAATYADNCAGGGIAMTSGLGSGSTFGIGTHTEMYTSTDAAGNTATCSFTVTVQDGEAPTATCPSDMTESTDAGSCDAVVTYAAATYADNCVGGGIAMTSGLGSGSTFGIGTNTEMYTSTDAAGNTATCSFTITVEDGEAPAITCPSSIISGTDAGLCKGVVTWTEPTPTDNCSATAMSSHMSGAQFSVTTTTVTYTAMDAAGNTSTCSFDVTINDTELPVIVTCPSDVTAGADAGSCAATVDVGDLVATDNCNVASIVNDFNGTSDADGVYSSGMTTVNWTVTDDGGNTATCSFNVTVNAGSSSDVLATASSTMTADFECTDAEGWTHYYHSPSNTILLSIQKNGENIGTVGDGTFALMVGTTGNYGSGSATQITAPYVTSDEPWYVMNRYWDVTATNQPTSPVKIRFYYTSADVSDVQGSVPSISTDTEFLFYKLNGANSDPSTGHAGVGSSQYIQYDYNASTSSLMTWKDGNYGSHRYAEYDVDSFSGGGGGGSNSNLGALPVEFLDFSATVEENDVTLHWVTSRETNNAGFEVQMQPQGANYEAIGQVAGQGTTTEQTTYAYKVQDLTTGIYVFRLKQEDLNGDYTFSNQIEVSVYNEDAYTLYYQNPIVGGTTDISLQVRESQLIKMGLYSLDGQLVQSLYNETLEAHTPIAIPLNTHDLAEGMYILKVQGNVIQQLSHKVLIMK